MEHIPFNGSCIITVKIGANSEKRFGGLRHARSHCPYYDVEICHGFPLVPAGTGVEPPGHPTEPPDHVQLDSEGDRGIPDSHI